MKRILPCIALVVFFITSPPAAAEPSSAYKYRWKVATMAPQGMGWAMRMEQTLFPLMYEITKGELDLKVYWGGSKGDEKAYLQKIKEGELQGAGFSSMATVELCPEMAVLQLPFLFNDYLEVDFLRIKLDRCFNETFKKNGLFLMAWVDQDFDQVYSTKYPMTRLEDFKKSRFLSWNGPVEQAVLGDLGAEFLPITITDFATAMEKGEGDAVIAPAVGIIGLQAFSRFRFVNPVKIRYSPATNVFSIDALNELPAKYVQEILWTRPIHGWRFIRQVRQDNDLFLQALVKYGLKESEMTPEELQAIRAATKKVWTRMAGKMYSQKLLQTVEDLLAQYRAGQKLTMDDILDYVRLDDKPFTPQKVQELKQEMRKRLKDSDMEQEKLIVLD